MGKEGGGGGGVGWQGEGQKASGIHGYMYEDVDIGGYWSVVKFLPQLAVMLQSD